MSQGIKLNITPEERKARIKEQVKKARKKYNEKLKNDPEFREAKLAKDRERNKKRYHNEPEHAAKINAATLKTYYEKVRPNPELMQKRRDRVKGYQRKRRERFKETKTKLQQTLGGKCIDCGITDSRLLDFDHKDPAKKLFNISQYIHLSVEDLLSEVNKCELRCPNCHRLKTLEQGGYNSYKLRKYRNEFHVGFKSLISNGEIREKGTV